MPKLLIFLFLTTFLSSCALKKGEIFTYKDGPLKLNIKNVEFIFIDLRGAKEGNIDLPIISTPGETRAFRKRFPDKTLKELLEKQIVLNEKAEKEATIVVTTVVANQYFQATWLSEIEAVSVKLLVSKISGNKTCEGSKEIHGQVSSIDASTSYINSMLEKAISLAFREALEKCT